MEINEKQFQAQIIDLCKIFGWEYYFVWKSYHSPQGFPDLVMINPTKRKIIVSELKSEKGKLTSYQEKWIKMFKDCGIESYVWRPSQFNEIVEILK